ncbi:hypothetical protein ACKCRG_002778 [Serratia marcescens]
MINVIAREGIRVPKEEMPDRYITDSEAVSVEQSAYYRRRLHEGDLLLVSDTAPGDAPETDAPEQALPAKAKGVK